MSDSRERADSYVKICDYFMTDFLDALQERVLVCDGATGTMLYAKGVFINRCFDELNLSSPELVSEVHAAYVQAGADIIETNTFGANRHKLMMHGLVEQIGRINSEGARLAREAAGDGVYVAGAIGPLDLRVEPWGKMSIDEAREAFREQSKALLEGGVDLFILETFSDMNEIYAAIRGVRDASNLPIVAQITIEEDGNNLEGTPPEVFGRRVDEWGADVVGLNCSVGPQAMLDGLERLARVTTKKLSVQPNAGRPRNVEGRNLYLCSPEYMASYARKFVRYGAGIVGGCCGTTPEHIQAIRAAVRSAEPAAQHRIISAPAPEKHPETIPREDKSEIARKLVGDEFVCLMEMVPPHGHEFDKMIENTAKIHRAGIDGVTIVEGSQSSARMSAVSMALLIRIEVGIPTCVRFNCSNHNLLGMQADLLGAYALGLRNLLLVTGQPPRIGDYPDATAVFDVDSIGLTNMVARLNNGIDVGGKSIGKPTGFLVGVMANPGAIDADREMKRLTYKIEAGAEFLVTPPVFDSMLLERFVRKVEKYRIPVIAGLEPLASYRDADFINNELPGSSIPETVLERMRKKTAPESANAEGVLIAQETLGAIHGMVQGVQLSAPSNNYDRAVEILSVVDLKGAAS